MAMGGITHYRYPKSVDVVAPKFKTKPDYLSDAALKALDLPTAVVVKGVMREGGRVHVDLEVQTTAKGGSKAKVFFGPDDMLTFDHRWAKSQDLGELAAGAQRISFDGAPESGFCRVQVTNETGSYFTHESAAWK